MALTLQDDTIEFHALFPDQNEATIRARWVAWANEGVDLGDANDWVDTDEGSFWQIATTGMIRECARLYDRGGTEVLMAGHPLWAFDTYLDDWGEVQDLARQAATSATGEVTFTNITAAPIDVDVGTEVGVEPVSEDADAPAFQVTEAGIVPPGDVLTVPIRATEPGTAGNVASMAISLVLSNLPGVTVTNEAPTAGGTEPESDEPLRSRLLEAYRGAAGGWNIADYKRAALNYPGVGRVSVIPVWAGPGTVQVIVFTREGGPVAEDVRLGLQDFLDPDPGLGAGEAMVGHAVTVSTGVTMEVTVAATIEFDRGYSLDGTAGTVALRTLLQTLVSAYIDKVSSGDELVLAQVAGALVAPRGVHDVADVTIAIDGGAPVAANVPVPLDPPKVPVLVAFNPVEGVVP